MRKPYASEENKGLESILAHHLEDPYYAFIDVDNNHSFKTIFTASDKVIPNREAFTLTSL